MSEHESDVVLFHSTKSKIIPPKISLKLLSNGHISVDWSDLPKHRTIRQCVIHYKSLNTNRSEAIRVSRNKQNTILPKIQSGHLYEIHVCTIDRLKRIIASSERAQIQTKVLNQAPILRVTKLTPDFIWLEWEIPEDVKLSDIDSYKLLINGEIKVVFPSIEKKFSFNDGKLGERYVFLLEMCRKDGKVVSSLPIDVKWPGVTVPEHHVFINGCEELIICWGNSKSINDGNIESYTLHLYDSEYHLLNKIGPNPPECRQVWLKEVTKGVYYYVLETKLANSKKSIYSKYIKIECGRESTAPVLKYDYADSHYREKLITMAYRLIQIRDNMQSNLWQEKCERQLEQILFAFNQLTGSLHLKLNIESKSNQNTSQTYRLFIDGEENNASIPGFIKDFPLELPRRNKPYELAVSIASDTYGTKSKKVLIEASGHLPFFCAHFDREQSVVSCSYMQTLLYEKRKNRPINQGSIKSPEKMIKFQVYGFTEKRPVFLPLASKGHRLRIIFCYIKQCVPSITHLNYFSTYASSYPTRYHYISINCQPDDIEDFQNFTQDFQNLQCYTDFSSDESNQIQNQNKKPLHELLSLDGVPTYFILNFSDRIVWKGRLCVQSQSEYDRAMDHITGASQQHPCSTENCELCSYRSMENTQIDSELNVISKDLQSIVQEQSLQIGAKQAGEKLNRTRRVLSMKTNQENKYE